MYVKHSIARDLVSSEQPYREAKELLEAWGSWLSGLADWQWFVTLTLRDPSPNTRGWTRPGWAYAAKAQDAFLARLKPALGELYWVSVLELQKWRGAPHKHLLVAGLDDTKYAEVGKWYWEKFGFCRILDYDPTLGAGFYLCKYVTKELGDVAFSPSLTKV